VQFDVTKGPKGWLAESVQAVYVSVQECPSSERILGMPWSVR
jgi:hypothetical protein